MAKTKDVQTKNTKKKATKSLKEKRADKKEKSTARTAVVE